MSKNRKTTTAAAVEPTKTRVCASPFCEELFTPNTHNQKYHKGQCKRDVENINKRRTIVEEVIQEEMEIRALLDDVEPDEQIEYLRSINKRLARENATLKTSKKEMVEAVFSAFKDSIEDIRLTPPKPPKIDKRAKVDETAIAVLSDWQLGKKTLTYNADVCEARLEKYGDKLLRITELQRSDHPVKHLKVWMLGDIIEGEQIFPGQAHHIDLSLYHQLAVGPKITVKFLRRMLEHFETVSFVGIAGNHGAIGGRSRHEMHPSSNADRMLYNTVNMIMEDDPRMSWNIPSGELEGDFYVVEQIGKKKYLLFHGHQIGGGSGVPVTGLRNKITGWAMGAIPHKFDYALLGHFHNPTKLTINNVEVWINGTTESSNGWAVEKMAAFGRPSQYLLFAHPEHGITAEYPIKLDTE